MIILLAEFYASGGTRTYIEQLLDFYFTQKIEVMLVGLESNPDDDLGNFLAERGVTYISYSSILTAGRPEGDSKVRLSPKVWSYSFMRRERTAFRDFIDKTRAAGIVVSAGTPGIFAGAAGAAKSNLYILHTYPHGRRQQYLGRIVMRRFFKRVTAFVSVSQFEKEEILRLWGVSESNSRITVIPNTMGRLMPPKSRQKEGQFQIITTSWLEPYKNPELWLEVAMQVTTKLGRENVRFMWLGGGSLLGEFQRRQEATGQYVDAQFIGHVENVAPYYQSADLYLQLSTTENMSLSVIDALRHGVPAVVTNVGGLPEIVEHGRGGVIVPLGSPELIADSVVQILKNSTEWLSLSLAGQERYEEFFSPDIWIEKMRSLHLTIFKTDSPA